MKKVRADLYLVSGGFFESREKAKRAIMAGIVYANLQPIHKASDLILPDSEIMIKGNTLPYVSRGGLKLEKAIAVWSLDFSNSIVLDIGASTGGFTDCSLQHGASHVFAVDVGTNQLAWKLRSDARVTVYEKTNFRYFEKEKLMNQHIDYVVIDVSFISLSLIFEHLRNIIDEDTRIMALIKPQFEAGPEFVGKKGVIKDPKIHKMVIKQTIDKLSNFGFHLIELTHSPIQGGIGNTEFISLWQFQNHEQTDSNIDVDDIVNKAQENFS